MTWRFLDTGKGSAAFNMAVDEALFTGVIDGSSPPTFRTYRWDPPCFSIGYNQDMNRQVDPRVCEMHGITRVRRFTGGRTVLHGWDLTYSVAAPVENIAPGETMPGAYAGISLALVRGLRSLGLSAEFARPSHRDPAGRSVKPCFTSVSRFEVSCRGRKIIGSAQRVVGNVLLQHGSLPLGSPPVGPHMFVPRMTGSERKRLDEELHKRSTCLSDELGRNVLYSEVRDALVRGFEEVFGTRFSRGDLSPAERANISRLEERKYLLSEWNDTRTSTPSH